MSFTTGNYTTGAGVLSMDILVNAFRMAQPTCQCGAPPTKQTPQGALLCAKCAEEYERRAAIAQAPNWLTLAFRACAPDQRQKLYRQLATVFHPDSGGSEELMKALNAVKERFGQ